MIVNKYIIYNLNIIDFGTREISDRKRKLAAVNLILSRFLFFVQGINLYDQETSLVYRSCTDAWLT